MPPADDNTSLASKSQLSPSVANESTTVDSNNSPPDMNRAHTPYSAPEVAQEEMRAVKRAKILVAVVMLVSAAIVSTAIYSVSVFQDKLFIQNLFNGYASETVILAQHRTDQLLHALDAFATHISSSAALKNSLTGSNQSWPFYAVDEWSLKAKDVGELSGTKTPYLTLAPIVSVDNRQEWESFARQAERHWYQESIVLEGSSDKFSLDSLMEATVPFIHEFGGGGLGDEPKQVTNSEDTLPIFQQYPLQQSTVMPSYMDTGFDMLSEPFFANLLEIVQTTGQLAMGIQDIPLDPSDRTSGTHLMQPVFSSPLAANSRDLVAVLLFRLDWMDYFDDLLFDTDTSIYVVLQSICTSIGGTGSTITNVVTYRIDSEEAVLLGDGDWHDTLFDRYEFIAEVVNFQASNTTALPDGQCQPSVTLKLYPTREMEEKLNSFVPPIYRVCAALAMLSLPGLVFLLYDRKVRRHQRRVMERVVQQDMIVSNVFPAAIRDRLYAQNEATEGQGKQDDMLGGFDDEGRPNTSPSILADLFPSTTVIFADIAGFTAWSSQREPQQVFILLETIFGALDQIAYRRGVFKVETVGDCLVAVAGLPDPMEDKVHAAVACKFALDCMNKMKEITSKLEVTLGPDTADLELRIGVHSGQVTAGVLRGERSRFQLFGDTINVASRMESTGQRSRVQLSEATAELLRKGGRGNWIIPRTDRILVKGKGEMQTYWLLRGRGHSKDKTVDKSHRTESTEDSFHDSTENEGSSGGGLDEIFSSHDKSLSKMERLVEWNVEILSSLLQQVIASRDGQLQKMTSVAKLENTVGSLGTTVLEEFVPIIPLKRFDNDDLKNRKRSSAVHIDEEAKSQLRKFLTNAAGMYRDNAFHNFEHASHVTASVKKLLTRIVNVDQTNGLHNDNSGSDGDSFDLVDLAGHSYGITSDPLTQFAVVFSAIIHDLDHPGVPNAQLVKEKTRNAQIYQKSIAEQNSVDLAWEMLMQEEFSRLRSCIYTTEEELKRFRQLVVNTVMATDIVDKELQELRKNRWETAFNTRLSAEESFETTENRKATIVIEHLIQASDVSHTMQHWHIYKKWNQMFFMECYGAYKAGRADVDPSINWYKGEIGFFDFYVIPLAKKLESCGVFGVSSHEYLNYATANRDEWAREGEKLVKEYLATWESERDGNMIE